MSAYFLNNPYNIVTSEIDKLGQDKNCGLIEEETGRSEDMYKICLEVAVGYISGATLALLCVSCTVERTQNEHM
jgi:hypothetical protein